MSDHVELIWYGNDAPWYDHGPQHPLRPARVLLTRALIHEYGLIDDQRVRETPARDATDDELLLVHTEQYIDAVRRAGRGERADWWRFGFEPGDNPIFPHMHEASARVVGASLAAAEAVHSGRADHAFNPAGGLHHAMPDRASGFCVYDDPAVAIRWLLERGVERVAYVDVDVHHGDGPQAIFYEDPRVLTISLHQTGQTLFPGTGFVDEHGGGDAVGTKVNVPLPPFTGDDAWLMAFRSVVIPLVEAWQPGILVTQLGCDTHCTDPLAHLLLTTAAYRQTAAILHDLAHRVAGGRWLATGGGGYQWAAVVPRAWTIYFAEMAGMALADDLPPAWIEAAEAEAGHPLPPPERGATGPARRRRACGGQRRGRRAPAYLSPPRPRLTSGSSPVPPSQPLEPLDDPLRCEGVGEQQLDLGRDGLGADEEANPVRRDDVDDREDHPAPSNDGGAQNSSSVGADVVGHQSGEPRLEVEVLQLRPRPLGQDLGQGA